MAKAKQGVPDSDSLRKVSELCLALPEATLERSGSHATFRVRKKVFAYFLDNHHGDGIVAACVKGDKREHARLIKSEPSRFFLPAYIGPRGFVGVRVDTERVDWEDVAERVSASYRAVAPKGRSRSLASPARRRDRASA